MEKVQNLKNSNTAPSSKTFRDEYRNVFSSSDMSFIQKKGTIPTSHISTIDNAIGTLTQLTGSNSSKIVLSTRITVALNGNQLASGPR
jgi:hypothetical protein